MTREDRREWLASAMMAIGHLPEDLLRHGSKAAMLTADHPSKIIPAIIKATDEDMKIRRRSRERESETLSLPPPAPHNPTDEDLAEIENIKREFGIRSSVDPGYPVERPALRIPTAADYVAAGLAPDAAKDAARHAREESGWMPSSRPVGKQIGDALP